jgi:hypothetical protein
MRDMKFENFSLPLDLDLYSETCANATAEEISDWEAATLRECLGKISCSYSVERQAFVAAITADMGKTTDAIRCTSMFGKTPLQAKRKLLYLVEECRWLENGEDKTREEIEERTMELKMAFRALKK